MSGEIKDLLNKGFQGFGLGSWNDVEYINKALAPSWVYDVTSEGATAGDALRVQSLENTLKIVTYQTKHFNFWKEIPKIPAYSTIEEYVRLEQVGGRPGTAFFTGGENAPPSEDSVYSRQYAVVKFLGTTRAITLAMARTRTILGDMAGLIAQENLNATNWILRNVEWGLFNGFSKGRDNNEFIHFDGLPNLIYAGNVIDARDYNTNAVIEEKMLFDAGQLVLDNFGMPTHVIMPYKILDDFIKIFSDRQRVFLPTQEGYTAGVLVTDYIMQSGTVKILPDLFVEKTPTPVGTSTTEDLNMVSGSATNTGTIPAGDYIYGVEFIDSNGDVVNNTTYTGSLTLGSEGGITIDIKGEPTSDASQQVWVYLSEAGGSNLYLVKKDVYKSATPFSITLDGNASNHVMPNTYSVYVGELSTNVIAFKQLAPLVKMDLAVIGPAYRWMVLLYGTPVMYAPKKWAKIVNLKSAY